MKKISIIIIFISLLMLIGCEHNKEVIFRDKSYKQMQKEQECITYESEDKEIIKIEKLQSDKFEGTYNDEVYVIEGDLDNLTVNYPNGVRGTETSSTNYYSEDIDDKYPSIGEFWGLLLLDRRMKGTRDENGYTSSFFHFLLGAIILIASIISIVNPEGAFYLERGWKFKDAEPSDAYLELTKVGGIIGIIIGVIVLFTSCS